jgi:hypothetical protein
MRTIPASLASDHFRPRVPMHDDRSGPYRVIRRLERLRIARPTVTGLSSQVLQGQRPRHKHTLALAVGTGAQGRSASAPFPTHGAQVTFILIDPEVCLSARGVAVVEG